MINEAKEDQVNIIKEEDSIAKESVNESTEIKTETSSKLETTELNPKKEITPGEDIIKVEKVKKKRFIPTIGMAIGLMVYFAWGLTIFFLITGSTITRTVLVLLLIYQFCFAKKNESYLNFLRYMKPWEYFNSYTVHLEEELSPDHSLFSFHPHGVLGFGAAMSPAIHDILWDSVFCGSRAMINLPISGIFARWMGVQGVNNKNFKEFLKKRKKYYFCSWWIRRGYVNKIFAGKNIY